MSDSTLRLFGAPMAVRDGVAVSFARKPIALLAFLAVSRERVRRDALAALLWPETTQNQASTNVRKALWSIRKKFGQAAVIANTTTGTLRLNPDVRVDVSAFETFLDECAAHDHPADEPCADCFAPLSGAVAIFRTGFLAGFGLSDSAEFDNWQHLHSERLRQHVLRALDRLLRLHVSRGEYDEALACAQRQLEVDYLFERAHQHVMRLYAWMDRPADALRQSAHYHHLIDSEFGLAPNEDTVRLAETIRDEGLEPPPLPYRGRGSHPLARISVETELAQVIEEDAVPRASTQSAEGRLLVGLMDDQASVLLSEPELRAIATRPAADLASYRIARLARWTHPRYRLDERFVSMSLLVDQGRETAKGRWLEQESRYRSLGQALQDLSDPILVILGAPGSGKSTLLRHLEMTRAAAAVQSHRREVPFLLELSGCHSDGSDEAITEPAEWVAAEWRRRYSDLPPYSDLITEGRALLLLDGLNELPHRSANEYFKVVERWKAFAHDVVRRHPDNRLVFSCRSLDYSTPLSSAELRVPQLRVEALTDERIQRFLEAHAPDRASALWRAIADRGQVDVFRIPFFLRLLTDVSFEPDVDRLEPAALITNFVRHGLRREIDRGHPALAPSPLFGERDRLRLVQAHGWPTAHHLPEQGSLISLLVELAFHLQGLNESPEQARVRVPFEQAVQLLEPWGELVLQVGGSLAVLEEDLGSDEVMFSHQLIQEYFAARRLAVRPAPELSGREVRAKHVVPPLTVLLPALGLSDRLPQLPRSQWDESLRMASDMTDDPDAFILGLLEHNRALAGDCAARTAARGGLARTTIETMQAALLERLGDQEADLRDREECGLALGRLGDPRFERHVGPMGPYIEPPMAFVPGDRYPIGRPIDEQPIDCPCMPYGLAHEVDLEAFEIGQFAVTNAEWRLFRESDCFADLRWWTTPDARDWIEGPGFTRAVIAEAKRSRAGMVRLLAGRQLTVEGLHDLGELTSEGVTYWEERLSVPEDQDEAWLEATIGSALDPRKLHVHPDYRNPSQPVIDVCWYEARAYAAWLSHQSGRAYRLPTEVEWEAAARGTAGHRYAYGNEFDPMACNGAPLRLHRPTPVGMFPSGATACGALDLTGNTADWTSSLWGTSVRDAEFAYPYDPDDGRENPTAASDIFRIIRGGCFYESPDRLVTDWRSVSPPYERSQLFGFRLVRASTRR